ncbi:MAG: hypothetical protein JKY56_08650 [Kofleriaceae bacterium]|nr:hypothetical protein [Kofleriaceae bacterium]
MNQRFFILTIAAIACITAACLDSSAPTITELSITITTNGQSASVRFREVLRPQCTCSAGNFPNLGECVGNSDGVTCVCDDTGPATCIESVSALAADGSVIAKEFRQPFLWLGAISIGDLEMAEQLLVEGCGGSAIIDLPQGDYPVSTIRETTFIDQETFQVRWGTAPAATQVLTSGGNGFTSGTCLSENTGTETFFYSDIGGPFSYSIRPVKILEQQTELGNVTIRYGVNERHLIEP